jgi:hypothetical protein
MVFSATFSNISVTVYRGGQFYLCGKPGYLEKTTDLLQYAHDHDGPLLEVNIGIFQNDKI